MIQDINTQTDVIQRLSAARFVVHFWQNLSILGTDGAMFHLNTKALDVDGDNLDKETGKSGGLAYIKRMRLVPVTTTERAIINNREGFAASNMFVGSIGADGQPVGMGSNMSGATKTNVRAETNYPEAKLADMMYTFGKYGLVAIRSLTAHDAESHIRCQKIFKAVMSGLSDRTKLEDIPEYFGEESPYLIEKKPARFPLGTAIQRVEAAYLDSIEIDGETVKLNDEEHALAERLIAELTPSVMAAHTAALDPEANGILSQTREGLQSGQKRSYDKCDQWLMSQFPSYPMDTTLEKANQQLLKALDGGGQDQAVQTPEGFVPIEDFYKMQEAFELRLAAIEEQAKAAAANGQQSQEPATPAV